MGVMRFKDAEAYKNCMEVINGTEWDKEISRVNNGVMKLNWIVEMFPDAEGSGKSISSDFMSPNSGFELSSPPF